MRAVNVGWDLRKRALVGVGQGLLCWDCIVVGVLSLERQ